MGIVSNTPSCTHVNKLAVEHKRRASVREARDGSEVERNNMGPIAFAAAMDNPGDAKEGNNGVDRGR